MTNRNFDEVISCLEQAILHGQIQPWTHEVLAVAMKAAGRPDEQIVRVLMSSQDLMSNDANSMMSLAARLASMGRSERAIELYRQAAALDPSRPEPYILSLELAVKSHDAQAVAWSAPEVLSYSWCRGREHLNRLAEQAASDAIAEFTKRGDLNRAFELQAAMSNARHLDLVVRVEWNGQGDLDMDVEEPGGTVCSFAQPMTAAGGIFTHDGYGPNQEHCYEEYLCPQGFPGEYRIVIKHTNGTIVGKRARVFIIRDRGTPNEETVVETVFLGRVDQSVRLSLSHGRRAIANAEEQTLNTTPKTENRQLPAYLAQLGNAGTGAQVAVGPNAVGYTPVMTMINEGVRMGAMATVSGDRRYVRLNLTPAFSTITDVFTFTPVR